MEFVSLLLLTILAVVGAYHILGMIWKDYEGKHRKKLWKRINDYVKIRRSL